MSKHFVVYVRPQSSAVEEREFASYEEAHEFYRQVSGLGWTSYYTSACILHEFDRKMFIQRDKVSC
jgi:hypothetical protein